jgi:hypothetical protein
MYNHTILRKMLDSPWNPNPDFIPEHLDDIFGFLDGTGLEIARPGGGVQNPFYNGYMHGHYLIFQGMSFPDGLTLVEGPWPGYHTDIMCWNDSEFKTALDAIMAARVAAGLPRLKLYADKIYNNSVLITAAYSQRQFPGGLPDWAAALNRLMSGIRVGVEWAFGKIIVRNAYMGFGRAQRIRESPVRKYYHPRVRGHELEVGQQPLPVGSDILVRLLVRLLDDVPRTHAGARRQVFKEVAVTVALRTLLAPVRQFLLAARVSADKRRRPLLVVSALPAPFGSPFGRFNVVVEDQYSATQRLVLLSACSATLARGRSRSFHGFFGDC